MIVDLIGKHVRISSDSLLFSGSKQQLNRLSTNFLILYNNMS